MVNPYRGFLAGDASAVKELIEKLRELVPEITGKSYYWGKLVHESAGALEDADLAISALSERVEFQLELLRDLNAPHVVGCERRRQPCKRCDAESTLKEYQ